MVKSCWICKTAGNKLSKSYFRIPKVLFHRNSHISRLSALRMEKWRKILYLPDDTSGIRICSDHFLSGNPARLLDVNDPDWIPNQKLDGGIKNNISKYVEEICVERNPVKTEEKLLGTIVKDSCTKCRFCSKIVKRELCTNIFESMNKNVMNMISTVLGYKISFDETLPSVCCRLCVKKLHVCSMLLTFFRNNEEQLNRSLVSTVCYEQSIPKQHKMRHSEALAGAAEALTSHESVKGTTGHEKKKTAESREQFVEKRNPNCPDDIGEQCKVTSDESLGPYDKEQIHSIIEDNCSSDEGLVNNPSSVILKKRKYNTQDTAVKTIEMKTLKCNNCYKKFDDLNDLKFHKHFCKLFYCQLCRPQRIFRDKNEQITHSRKYHSHSLVCHVCGKNYSQSYLVKHFRNHFERRRICPFCSKIFKNVTVLMAHVNNIHGTKLSGVCELCGGKFKNMKKHLSHCGKTEF